METKKFEVKNKNIERLKRNAEKEKQWNCYNSKKDNGSFNAKETILRCRHLLGGNIDYTEISRLVQIGRQLKANIIHRSKNQITNKSINPALRKGELSAYEIRTNELIRGFMSNSFKTNTQCVRYKKEICRELKYKDRIKAISEHFSIQCDSEGIVFEMKPVSTSTIEKFDLYEFLF